MRNIATNGERLGHAMLMFDSAEFCGPDEASTGAYFFERTRDQFLREIRDDIDSFFGYPDGCPTDDAENAEHYRAMWEKLLAENEFEENGRRVVLTTGTAIVK